VTQAADLGALDEAGSIIVRWRRTEEDVVDALGVGLHVAGEAFEHLADGG
jgi:hypothetical protein